MGPAWRRGCRYHAAGLTARGSTGRAGEGVLAATLSRTQDQGWQAERLVRTVTDKTGFSWADDPAAALTKRVSTYTREHRAPARIGVPTDDQRDRWRTIVAHHLPDAPVGSPQWDIVWRHAAGGNALGLDADAALTDATTHLATTTTGAADGDYGRTGEALVAALTERHHDGEGHHHPLPWQAHPDFGRPGDHRGTLERLDTLNAEIAARTEQLREHVACQTSHVGHRHRAPTQRCHPRAAMGPSSWPQPTVKPTESPPPTPPPPSVHNPPATGPKPKPGNTSRRNGGH